MKDINNDPFSDYIKNLPPGRRELGQAWSTAIGLQDVDGLKPSEYLYETAKKSIDGELSIDEVGEHINSYYESKGVCPDKDAGVRFRENPALATWHADARGYDMTDASGQLRARFYLDPYARAKKRGGAWMDSAVSRFANLLDRKSVV